MNDSSFLSRSTSVLSMPTQGSPLKENQYVCFGVQLATLPSHVQNCYGIILRSCLQESSIQLIGRFKGWVNFYSNESHDSHMALTTDHMNFAPPTNSDTAHVSIISPDWDFKEMGIGGLDKVCRLIFNYSIAEFNFISFLCTGIFRHFSKSFCLPCVSSWRHWTTWYLCSSLLGVKVHVDWTFVVWMMLLAACIYF